MNNKRRKMCKKSAELLYDRSRLIALLETENLGFSNIGKTVYRIDAKNFYHPETHTEIIFTHSMTDSNLYSLRMMMLEKIKEIDLKLIKYNVIESKVYDLDKRIKIDDSFKSPDLSDIELYVKIGEHRTLTKLIKPRKMKIAYYIKDVDNSDIDPSTIYILSVDSKPINKLVKRWLKETVKRLELSIDENLNK